MVLHWHFTHSVIELLQAVDGEKCVHAHSILQKQFHKVYTIVDQGIHHCLLQPTLLCKYINYKNIKVFINHLNLLHKISLYIPDNTQHMYNLTCMHTHFHLQKDKWYQKKSITWYSATHRPLLAIDKYMAPCNVHTIPGQHQI